jgi:spore maturation protein CgeB
LTSVCFDYFPDINKYESLNTNIVQSYDSDYLYAVRPRILTMMGAGTPVFIDRHPLIEEMFTDGVEVVMWKGIEDLCERFLQYQKTPKVLRNIAAQGHKKVLSAYSVEQRLAQTILPVIVG